MTAHHQQVVGWRDHLPVHPAANLLPLIGKDELRELADDIAQHGLRDQVAIYDDPEIGTCLLDGRNRLDALELLGQKIFDDDGELLHGISGLALTNGETPDPVAYVLSKNVHRRHLTSEQKRELIARVLKAEPEKSNLQIAKQVKADDKTVAKVRTELESRSEIPNVEKRTDTKGRKQPVKPRGMTQKRKLGIFDRTISLIYNRCEATEDALNDFLPRLSAQQKADAKQQLTDAIGILRKCVARVAKAEGAP